jgi:hypothetical protein
LDSSCILRSSEVLLEHGVVLLVGCT